jgi:hypothetical protein
MQHTFSQPAMIPGVTELRLDPSATFAPTQHALAGKAAVGLAQLTQKDAQVLARIPPDMLTYIQSVNHVAQKADLTRKILERYLFGTDISRIDPVMVPYTPETTTTYSVPSGDPDVFQTEHISHKTPVPLRNIGTTQTASFKPNVARADAGHEIASLLSSFSPRNKIKSFI